jgi:hypothetical protein
MEPLWVTVVSSRDCFQHLLLQIPRSLPLDGMQTNVKSCSIAIRCASPARSTSPRFKSSRLVDGSEIRMRKEYYLLLIGIRSEVRYEPNFLTDRHIRIVFSRFQ